MLAIQLREPCSPYVCQYIRVLDVSASAAGGRFAAPGTRSRYRGGIGGAEEARTPDPLLAKEVLSQLSYGPLFVRDVWWGILDSNQRPQSYQDCALTS
jgi:hypothetical protein